jgi:hypothetical protein
MHDASVPRSLFLSLVAGGIIPSLTNLETLLLIWKISSYLNCPSSTFRLIFCSPSKWSKPDSRNNPCCCTRICALLIYGGRDYNKFRWQSHWPSKLDHPKILSRSRITRLITRSDTTWQGQSDSTRMISSFTEQPHFS